MRLVGYIVLAALAVALIQYILAALVVSAVLLLLWGVLVYPETGVPLLFFLLLLEALSRWPLAMGCLLLGAAAVLLICSRMKRAAGPEARPVPLLPPPEAVPGREPGKGT